MSQLLVIHEISKNITKPNTFLKQKPSAMSEACFIRRILVASNAIQTIDNEMIHLIIYCLNCIRRDRNATFKTGLRPVKVSIKFVKTRRRTTQTRKGTAISIFFEYFIYFIIFYQFDNFMKFYMHQRIFGENLIKIGLKSSAQW